MVWGGDISTIQNNINELLKENKKQTIDDYNNKVIAIFMPNYGRRMKICRKH
jgi:hypothetical protein